MGSYLRSIVCELVAAVFALRSRAAFFIFNPSLVLWTAISTLTKTKVLEMSVTEPLAGCAGYAGFKNRM